MIPCPRARTSGVAWRALRWGKDQRAGEEAVYTGGGVRQQGDAARAAGIRTI